MKPRPHSIFMFSAILPFATMAFAQEPDPNPSSSTPNSTGEMQQAEQAVTSETHSTRETINSQTQQAPEMDGSAASQPSEAQPPDNTGAISSEFSSSGSTHTERRSKSSSTTISADRTQDNDRRWRNDFPAPPDEAMFGRWTLGEENGDTCTIQLQNLSWFGGYKAYVPVGCPDGFFSAARWVISGNRLLITDTDNRVVGSFWPAGPDRWSGRRASDGARLYLNRR